MANPKTPNLGLNKVDRSTPTKTTFNTKPLIDDNMDVLDAEIAKKASATQDGRMSKEDFNKLAGIATGSNNYIHPVGDGSQHVPATGTANNGKVLMAGATVGSASWQSLPDVTPTVQGAVQSAMNTHKTAATLDHPDKSVTTAKIADKAVGGGQLADGAATDTVIGSRTISDTLAPSGNTATPTTLLGGLAYMVKAITGKASWWVAPRTTLENSVKRDGDTVNGYLGVVSNGGNGLTLVGNDHIYVPFFPKGLAAGRRGYVGYPSAESTELTYVNETVGGDVHLKSGPSGTIRANGYEILTAGNFNSATGIRINNGQLEYFNGSGWQPVGGLKALQSGEVAFPRDSSTQIINVPLRTVDVSKSIPRITYTGYYPANVDLVPNVKARITSPTNLQLEAVPSYNSNLKVAWYVEEYN